MQVHCSYPQYLQANAGIVPLKRPRPSCSKSLNSHHPR
jgi:hypothetical protein